MKRRGLCALLACVFCALPARGAYGKEIPNLLSAVAAAEPGDYIVSPTGKRYALTAAEIAIARGEFDYGDLSGAPTTTREDGTLIKDISAAHRAYIYPDGQRQDVLKTARSFTEYMKNHIEKKYHLGLYVPESRTGWEIYRRFPWSDFSVFRAFVQFQMITNGKTRVEKVTVTVYNYYGECYEQRWFGTDGNWRWGYVEGKWAPEGPPHRTEEFEVR